MTKQYKINIEVDPQNKENYLLAFPDEFIEESGWKAGDEIQVNTENNTLTLKKIDNVSAAQLSDEAWEFIKEHSDLYSETIGMASFEGDWGNWNWLLKEILKRCPKKED